MKPFALWNGLFLHHVHMMLTCHVHGVCLSHTFYAFPYACSEQVSSASENHQHTKPYIARTDFHLLYRCSRCSRMRLAGDLSQNYVSACSVSVYKCAAFSNKATAPLRCVPGSMANRRPFILSRSWRLRRRRRSMHGIPVIVHLLAARGAQVVAGFHDRWRRGGEGRDEARCLG